jgi:rhodanese-related sulfurtransferase
MRVTCSTDGIKHLKPEDVKGILEEDKKGEFIILDVRQPKEYEAGHIPGARLIPLGELETRYGELEKNKKIVTYCRSGHRSMGGAILLCGLGFIDVYSMDGGMLNWEHEILTGIPEERPEFITGKESLGDLLMITLKLEKGSQDFYIRAMEHIKSDEAMKILRHLAEIEGEHMKRIYERYITVTKNNELPPLEKLKYELSPEFMEGGIKIDKELLQAEERKYRDETEVLEVALEKEYTSYDFYKRTAGLVADLDTKAMLHELAGEERNHINNLLTEIDVTLEGGL